jgi:hypothetical protein
VSAARAPRCSHASIVGGIGVAKGSSTERGPYPPNCNGCGQRVVTSNNSKNMEDACFETLVEYVDGRAIETRFSWHVRCKPYNRQPPAGGSTS